VYRVKRFVEKPKRETAEEMFRTGTHLWNAGMFVFLASRMLEEYDRHLPKTGAAVRALLESAGTPRFQPVLADAWEETEQTTIDYGVMEHADQVAVVPANIGWHDVGNWARLADIVLNRHTKTSKALLGEGSKGVYVYSPEKVVAAIGVEDLVIVETDDALLVCRKDRAEEVKAIVERLQREGRTDLL
jgi:mannose-1-phosphate guanylyltransferase